MTTLIVQLPVDLAVRLARAADEAMLPLSQVAIYAIRLFLRECNCGESLTCARKQLSKKKSTRR